jgi:hypothetical protein
MLPSPISDYVYCSRSGFQDFTGTGNSRFISRIRERGMKDLKHEGEYLFEFIPIVVQMLEEGKKIGFIEHD